MLDVSSFNQSTIQDINGTGIVAEHCEAEILHDKEIGDTKKSRLTETYILGGRTEMNSEYEMRLTLQETFDVHMDLELLASKGEVEDIEISGLTNIIGETNYMSFAPFVNHALRGNLDSLSLSVSAALSSDIQENQTLSMNTTYTFSSIQVVSADAVENVLPIALNLVVSAFSQDIQEDQTLSMKNTSTLSSIQVFSADAAEDVLPLAQGLLDSEADRPRSLISENELSPSTSLHI